MPPPYTKPSHILCEGVSDANFIAKLMEYHGIDATTWDIAYPQKESEQFPGVYQSTGVSGYKAHLEGLETIGQAKRISRLLVLADNDTDPAASFKGIRTQMKGADFDSPKTAGEVMVANGRATAILMLPGNGDPGCLESLLLNAVLAARPELQRCVDDHCQCCSPNFAEWSISKQAKSRLHSLISGCCDSEPASALAYVWGKRGNPIPIESPAFNWIADFIRSFAGHPLDAG